MKQEIITRDAARGLLPPRMADGNKGTFGRVLLLVGSERYRGAAHLVTEAALRGGAGYVTVASEKCVTHSILLKYPEAILAEQAPFSVLNEADIDAICKMDSRSSAIVIGSGAGVSAGLFRLTSALLAREGAPLIIDADAINSLAAFSESPLELIAESRRPVIITPHPLEFSRLTGASTDEINAERELFAARTAKRAKCTVLLKGKGTVVTDGSAIFINSTGSSALAKAGSGDALAGLLGSLCAQGTAPLHAAALAAFIHGAAGDALSDELSDYGVTPSDLPASMARELKRLEALA